MSRIASQYPALNGGISQRPERSLRLNQLREQLNALYDPVMGLGRRPGLSAKSSRAGVPTGAASDYTVLPFTADGNRYSLYYSRGAGGLVVVNETAGTILAAPTLKGGDTFLTSVLASGVSAATAVGDLVVMAGAAQPPTYTVAYPWANPDNQRHHVVWVRGGAYSRAFKLTLIRGNIKATVTYTTREASYPKLLDTSDLLPTDPEYSKKVNDRTNAYNSEATAWIAAALADIAPENIASKLAAGLEQSGFLGPGETVSVVGSNVVINAYSVEEVEADDSGDGNLIRAVGNVVGAPELLTISAYPGKVVKVRPGNSERGEVFYLKARAKDASEGSLTPVTWEEAAGEESTPGDVFVYLTVSGTTAYASSDIAWINTSAGRSFPLPAANPSGDLLSNPPPEFFGEVVTALSVFQDRLLVCRKDGYVATSQPGDYLNFFRTSVVTSLPTDPTRFFVIGGEGDTVRSVVTYDKNLWLIGERQYVIPGNRPMVPGGEAAGVVATIPGIALPPVVVGDSLFYAKYNNEHGSMHVVRPGRVAEAPSLDEVTQDVNTLIATVPAQLLALATPDIVFLRGSDNKLYVADYYHVEGGQRYAIHHWDFPGAGSLLGIAEFEGSLRVLWSRSGSLYLEEMQFQQASRGTVQSHADAGRTFVTRIGLVSPRLSPEAGNITGVSLGAGGYERQTMTVGTVQLFFSDSGTVKVSTPGTGAPDRHFRPQET